MRITSETPNGEKAGFNPYVNNHAAFRLFRSQHIRDSYIKKATWMGNVLNPYPYKKYTKKMCEAFLVPAEKIGEQREKRNVKPRTIFEDTPVVKFDDAHALNFQVLCVVPHITFRLLHNVFMNYFFIFLLSWLVFSFRGATCSLTLLCFAHIISHWHCRPSRMFCRLFTVFSLCLCARSPSPTSYFQAIIFSTRPM